ncbi:MAG: hypothetical protein J6Z35_11385, partial [Lachnospiraceae bacterium]|nr:hypothetical protein [Lachnospiraceae bacterium]
LPFSSSIMFSAVAGFIFYPAFTRNCNIIWMNNIFFESVTAFFIFSLMHYRNCAFTFSRYLRKAIASFTHQTEKTGHPTTAE